MNLIEQEAIPIEESYLKQIESTSGTNKKYSVSGKTPVVQPDDPLIRYIPLTKGQFAIVNLFLYAWLMEWNWCAIQPKKGGKYYAVRGTKINGKYYMVWMHRFIMNAPKDMTVDHRNNLATLDNRVENLRLATRSQNQCNRGVQYNSKSGFKGVFPNPTNNTWISSISIHGIKVWEEYGFTDPEVAARVYDLAAIKYHGEFAWLNFPRSSYEIAP